MYLEASDLASRGTRFQHHSSVLYCSYRSPGWKFLPPRTLHAAFTTVFWRCRAQRYLYLAELRNINGRAHWPREPLTAAPLRVNGLLCHWASLGSAGSLIWVWLSLNSKKQWEDHSGASSSSSALTEQNKICFLNPSQAVVPTLFWLTNKQTPLMVLSGGNKSLRIWQTTFTDLLIWVPLVKSAETLDQLCLWLWRWGRIKEITPCWRRWEDMPFMPLTLAQRQVQQMVNQGNVFSCSAASLPPSWDLPQVSSPQLPGPNSQADKDRTEKQAVKTQRNGSIRLEDFRHTSSRCGSLTFRLQPNRILNV